MILIICDRPNFRPDFVVMSIRSDRTARGSERDYDRDGGRRAPREPPVRQPRIQLNEYFVDGEGILREVMQTEICKYLGAEATSRPGEYKVCNFIQHRLHTLTQTVREIEGF